MEMIFGDETAAERENVSAQLSGQSINHVEICAEGDASFYIIIRTPDFTIYADSPSIYRNP